MGFFPLISSEKYLKFGSLQYLAEHTRKMTAMITNPNIPYPFEFVRLTTPTSKGHDAQSVTGTNTVEVYKLGSKNESLSVDDMFEQLEFNDPRATAATEEGTKWVAKTFFSSTTPTLATLRLRVGISQRELGKRLGVSQPQIAKWERGETPNMQLRTVKNLANALSVELHELVSILISRTESKSNEL